MKLHRLEFGPLLLSYLFSEGTYVSIHDVSGSPSGLHLDSRPSASYRSTFERLPLLFC